MIINHIIVRAFEYAYYLCTIKCYCWIASFANKHFNILSTDFCFCDFTPPKNVSILSPCFLYTNYTPAQRSCWGVYWFHSIRPSVRLSVRPSVRPSRMPCPLCIIYSYGWIFFILGTNDHYHERVCRAPWPLTLTYIFKVIWPWLRKSCPLCSVYSSWWILSIFGTNDHYH